MTLSELELLLYGRGLEPRYARRLLYWVYRRAIKSFDEVADLPRKTLSALSAFMEPGTREPRSVLSSVDGSLKYLFENEAGAAYEAVYIPEGARKTLCLSVQAGCRMGCCFCATGSLGWRGNLSAGEIVNQVVSSGREPTHVVLMGMGEPCDNIDEVLKACQLLLAEWGLALGKVNVTLSTVGVLPAFKRLLEESECNITYSLHSPFPDERAAFIPAEKRNPSHEVLQMIRRCPPAGKRRFTIAYVMIKGVNDSERHLGGLVALLSGTGLRVNLLPYHPPRGSSLSSAAPETLMKFKHALVSSGIGASVRKSRGADIAAACGMLAAVTVGKLPAGAGGDGPG